MVLLGEEPPGGNNSAFPTEGGELWTKAALDMRAGSWQDLCPQGLEGPEDAQGPRANSQSPRADLPGVEGKGRSVWGLLKSWEDSPQALSWCSDQGCNVGLADGAGWGRPWELAGTGCSQLGRADTVKCHLASGPRISGHRLLVLSTS